MKKFTILAAICCFVLASCGGGGINGNSPSALQKTMSGYVKAGDYEKAVRFWAENMDIKDDEEAKKQMDQMVALFSGKLQAEVDKRDGVESIEILEETISEDGTKATVKHVTKYKNGENDEQTSKFVNVDGKWYFDRDAK